MTRVMPDAAAWASWWARNGTPAHGTSCLGRSTVSGRSRVPWPPTSRIASAAPAAGRTRKKGSLAPEESLVMRRGYSAP